MQRLGFADFKRLGVVLSSRQRLTQLTAMAEQPPNNPEENATDSDAGAFQGFSQEDIDAALAAANSGDAPAPSEDASAPDGELSQADIDAAMAAAGDEPESSDSFSQAEIDAAMASAAVGDDAPPASDLVNADGTPKLDSQGRPFDEAAAMMAAAIEEEKAAAAAMAAAAPAPAAAQSAPMPPPPAGSTPMDIPDFSADFDLADAKGIGLLNDVQLDVRIELGRSELYIEDVLKLGKGAVVELDRLAGDPVDVIVNDRLVARGEVLVLNDNFCVRISEILVGKDDS